jgi:hypothetical protein
MGERPRDWQLRNWTNTSLNVSDMRNSAKYEEDRRRERMIDFIAEKTRNIPQAIFHLMVYEQETSQTPLTQVDALKIVAANYNATGKYKIDINGVV